MKVREVREVVSRVQATHGRYRADETVQALRELAALLATHDDKTVGEFVKQLKSRRKTVSSSPNAARVRRRSR